MKNVTDHPGQNPIIISIIIHAKLIYNLFVLPQ